MQEVWRSGIKWDEYVGQRIEQSWRKWIELLDVVRRIEIPRCYFANATTERYQTLQAHLFVDASEAAYAAVVYFRIIDMEGNPQCSLVTAKTKVAPLKYVSIPRLELMAAVLGARLLTFVVENHTIPIQQRFCWSDSNTVLAWLRSEHRRYKQFVACRVGEVLTLTKENEWRWVPSRLNIADEATKWGKGPSFDAGSRWVQGPEFLSRAEELWPKAVASTVSTEEELRPCHLFHEVITPMVDFKRFSNWNRLLRTVAFVFHLFTVHKANKASTIMGKEPTYEDLRAAEIQILKMVQWAVYPDEMSIITRNLNRAEDQRSALDKSSSIYKLTPMIDETGVLRIDSRTGSAHVDAFDLKYPVILPRKHHVTYLIVDYYHKKFLHGNSETIVNELRQKYYIPRIRVIVRTVTRLCQWCKVYKSQPVVPRMGPLPEARLSPGVRPFSYIGIDYFGPILVKKSLMICLLSPVSLASADSYAEEERRWRYTPIMGEILSEQIVFYKSKSNASINSSGVKQPSVDLGFPDQVLRNSWAQIQEKLDHFWKRWIREYLPTLTRRTKWFSEAKPVNSGDIVVIIEDKKRNGWTRGRVLDVTKGRDGRIRQAVVQTSRGLFRRPVSKLAVLDVANGCNAEVITHPYGEGNVGDVTPHLATMPTDV
ncbi:uncharacterized protein LOC134221571 [Armigeres subalbatus]|uniref:uncharacterized protein LOC134221571 n=1 Tax=Armigeres subalbatus TaxID=124917 RepID=UPI002ECFF2B2